MTLAEQTDNLDIKLIFRKDKAIMSGTIRGNECVFENLPASKGYFIVATRCTADGIFYCAKEVESLDGKDLKINLAFQKYSTPEEVIAEYKKLDERLE